MTLFDSFPQDQQQRQLTEWITPGAIVYLYCPWVMKAYKDKYLLIGATHPECLLFMINTEVRYASPEQTQVGLEAANYPTGLTSNCWANCNTVVSSFTYTGVIEQVQSDSSRYRGHLTQSDRLAVVSAVKFANDIAPVHQDMIFDALGEAA